MTERAVLLFHFQGDQVLLIHKLRGLGKGKINAPGGRLEAGEGWAEAAVRETREETGREVSDLTEVADLWFRFTSGYELDVRVFFSRAGSGEIRPCDEADPFWCAVDQIPWHRMWADDPVWLPRALEGRYVKGRFLFEDETMLEADLTLSDRSLVPIVG